MVHDTILYMYMYLYISWTFLTGGYYTVKTTSVIRILALNTNLYYTSDKITAGIPDPADQFSWMENVLASSNASNEKVHYFSIYIFTFSSVFVRENVQSNAFHQWLL